MSEHPAPGAGSTASLVIWLLSLIILAAALLALGFSTGIEDVLENWPAHVSIVVILIVLELVAWAYGKGKPGAVEPA